MTDFCRTRDSVQRGLRRCFSDSCSDAEERHGHQTSKRVRFAAIQSCERGFARFILPIRTASAVIFSDRCFEAGQALTSIDATIFARLPAIVRAGVKQLVDMYEGASRRDKDDKATLASQQDRASKNQASASDGALNIDLPHQH